MLKRFAGPEFHRTPELVKAAQHDRQRFYVERFEDWREMDDDTVELLVHWRGD